MWYKFLIQGVTRLKHKAENLEEQGHVQESIIRCVIKILFCFSTKVASTHGDHTVRVTDITSGKCTHVLTGHPRTPWCVAFHPSSNEILASGCLGGEVRIWDLHVSIENKPRQMIWKNCLHVPWVWCYSPLERNKIILILKYLFSKAVVQHRLYHLGYIKELWELGVTIVL